MARGLDPQSGRPCPRILIVDDDEDQRELIADALMMYFKPATGGGVRGIGSVAECRQVDSADFDVVLLDYNLPDGTGLEALECFLKQGDLPIIFITGQNVVATAAEALRRGAQDYVIKAGDYLFAVPLIVEKAIAQHRIRQENIRLAAQLKATLEEVRVKNQQLQDSLDEKERMAATDYLTGLANRREFVERLERHFSEACRYQFDLTCVMLDLDHYKALNDTLGHQMGDRVLIATADVIRSSLRASDLAARYGGDEFVLLLPHTSIELAVSVVERIRREMAAIGQQYAQLGSGLTVSIGLSNLRIDTPATADTLVAMADRALYAAKDAGKNRIICHHQMGIANSKLQIANSAPGRNTAAAGASSNGQGPSK
jgi:diguanylate cyclase (GGDEF)-like protein